MGIGDEELFYEDIAFQFDGCFINDKPEDFEYSSGELKEANLVAGSDQEGGGVGRGGIVDGNG